MKSGGKYVFGFSIFLVLLFVILTAALALIDAVDAALFAVLVLMGVILGFFNVTRHEAREFLVASIVLVIGSSLAIMARGGMLEKSFTLVTVPFVGLYFERIFICLIAFFVPAIITVAMKTIYDLARE